MRVCRHVGYGIASTCNRQLSFGVGQGIAQSRWLIRLCIGFGQAKGRWQTKDHERAQSLLETSGIKGSASQNELASKITSSIASSSTISMMFSHSVIGHVSIFRQFYKCTYSRSSTSLVIRRDSLVYDQSLASTAPTAWSIAVWHSLASSPDVEKSSIWTTEFSSSDGGLLLLRDETCDIGSYTRWRWAWWCRN